MGLAARHPQALQACEVLRDSGFWTDGGINFYPHRTNRSETRISSMVLALVCWFQLEDTQVDRLAGTCLAGSWRMAVELPFQRGRPRLSRLVSYHHLGAGGIVGVRAIPPRSRAGRARGAGARAGISAGAPAV